MKLTSSVLDLDWLDVETKITRFISDYVDKIKAKGMIVGLSGGIDSCVAGALSAKAIGGNRILGLMLPEKETRNEEDIRHAKLVIKKFKLRSQLCDITSTLEAVYTSIPIFDTEDRVCKGNIKARTRMLYNYYYANKLNMLVCGSSDKSETMMGYFTKWGDVAADISPIMDLYKTQVKKLANHIGIPKTIIAKPPTPALWPGQTAEGELGIRYETLDLILYGLEHFMTVEEISEQLLMKTSIIKKVKQRWLGAEHKRRMLLTTKLEYRTVGTDFRLRRG
ncbi:NAD+ synthase [Candidatus Bathyarchaeota archaeon]|nr:NAD+ synthase [Candidatus Bathyarchaeota archaeon]